VREIDASCQDPASLGPPSYLEQAPSVRMVVPRDRIELSLPAFSGQIESEGNQIITPNRQCKKWHSVPHNYKALQMLVPRVAPRPGVTRGMPQPSGPYLIFLPTSKAKWNNVDPGTGIEPTTWGLRTVSTLHVFVFLSSTLLLPYKVHSFSARMKGAAPFAQKGDLLTSGHDLIDTRRLSAVGTDGCTLAGGQTRSSQ
jgi:hypothetical protein